MNLARLSKADIVKMAKWKCPLNGHSKHNGLEHPKCFNKLAHINERIGILDVECSGLVADFGILLTWCIKEYGKSDIYNDLINEKDLRGDLDKRITKSLALEIQNYDTIITYYGTKFDLSFIRSRCLYHNLDFSPYGSIKHIDVYYMVKSKLRLSRNRLETACRLLGIKGKTHLDGRYWVKALTGDKKAINYILTHNKADVIILEKLYDRIKDYTKGTNRSI